MKRIKVEFIVPDFLKLRDLSAAIERGVQDMVVTNEYGLECLLNTEYIAKSSKQDDEWGFLITEKELFGKTGCKDCDDWKELHNATYCPKCEPANRG